jgi:hypothetical protein
VAFEDGVFPTFYDEAVEDKSATEAKGYPVFNTVTYIKIVVPNQTDFVPRPATDADKTRFPKSWEAYRTGSEVAEDGHPVSQWPLVSVSERKILDANHIKTVEQLAEVADSGLHRLGPYAMSLKKRAQKFLDSRDEVATLRTSNKDLADKNAELEERIRRLEDKQEIPLPAAEPEKSERRRFQG